MLASRRRQVAVVLHHGKPHTWSCPSAGYLHRRSRPQRIRFAPTLSLQAGEALPQWLPESRSRIHRPPWKHQQQRVPSTSVQATPRRSPS